MVWAVSLMGSPSCGYVPYQGMGSVMPGEIRQRVAIKCHILAPDEFPMHLAGESATACTHAPLKQEVYKLVTTP